jgi:hypothetical protein
MSLRTDFFDGATGLHTKCNDAFDAGVTFVTVDNATAISNALKDNAASGKTAFIVSLITSYNTAILKGNSGKNLILKAYLAGIEKGLADGDIYNYEVSISLNVTDTLSTKVDLAFNFQTT